MSDSQQRRADFLTAIGEAFGDAVCPPIPEDEASPHQCCDVILTVLGPDISPATFASVTDSEVHALAGAFGSYFETMAPTTQQIRSAISRLLFRRPPGSYGEPR